MDIQADIIIMQVYHSDKGKNCALIAVDEIKRKLKQKWSEHKVVHRAIELGLSASRHSPVYWTEAEDLCLIQHAHLSATDLQKQFNRTFPRRTLSAIVARVNRLGGVRAIRGKLGFSLTELEKHLHISRATLKNLVANGSLAASRPAGRDWIFRKNDVRNFVAHFPEYIDWTRIDKYWLITLLTEDSVISSCNNGPSLGRSDNANEEK